jgi:hypothetical protein
MFTVTTHRSRGIWRKTTAKTFEQAKALAFELQESALDSEAYTIVHQSVAEILTPHSIVFAVDRTGEVKIYTKEPKDDDVLVLSGKMVTIDISKDSD